MVLINESRFFHLVIYQDIVCGGGRLYSFTWLTSQQWTVLLHFKDAEKQNQTSAAYRDQPTIHF